MRWPGFSSFWKVYMALMVCPVCEGWFEVPASRWQQRYCSDQCAGKARDAGSGGFRFLIFERDGWRCVYCGAEDSKLTVDHVVPRARGGGNRASNLAASCLSCNVKKNDKWLSLEALDALLSGIRERNRAAGIPDDLVCGMRELDYKRVQMITIVAKAEHPSGLVIAQGARPDLASLEPVRPSE
jgi:hypothetical protein